MFVKDIYKKFDAAKKKKIISDYRVFVSESEDFSSGIINKEIAGAYNPNKFSSQVSGNCLVQWQDKMISASSFNNEILYYFDSFLKDIKAMRYRDPAGANFLCPQKYPNVKLYDQEVAGIVGGKEKLLLDLMLKLGRWQDRAKTKLKEINVFASVSKNTIFTSKGLFAEEQATACWYSSVYDNKIELEDSLRQVPESQKLNKKRAFIENFYFHLSKGRKVKPKDKKMPIILMPWISKEIFSHFIIANLNGAAVYNKQSCFSLNDFKSKKQVLRQDISLICDPLVDFDIGSYIFTGEGVPSRKTIFIRNGRLENQILDLKYAKLQKKEPTGVLTKPLLKSDKQISFAAALKSIDQGVVVFDALGLHTQNPVSGDYSLPCPNALYVRKGRIVGRTRPIITGNFFENINQDDLKIINFPLEDFPGLLVESFASFEVVK